MIDDPCIKYFIKWFATALDSPEITVMGSQGQHIENITAALAELGYRAPPSRIFTEDLAKVVEKFQADHFNKNVDGKVGPNTRRLLTQATLKEIGPEFFEKLTPTYSPFYQVFVSYAWQDASTVNSLDQWLRDHGIVVRRDIRDFKAGQELPDEIQKHLHVSDKALIVYSRNSQSRDWPSFERFTAENVERLRGTAYLVYLILDGAQPPKHDPNRIYISGGGTKLLKEIGEELMHAIARVERTCEEYDYDENKPLPQ